MTHFQSTDDPCSHCGACLSFCPWDRLQRQNPAHPGSPDLCRDCMLCYSICARVHPAESYSDPALFGRQVRHPVLGSYREVWSAAAVNGVPGAQDGGATTALLLAMLEEGFIDGALVVRRDARWQPLTAVARTAEELLRAAGSKYSTAPALADLAPALESCRKLAVVCLPCQVTALRHMLCRGSRYSPERIAAILGLFCYDTFRHQGLASLVEGEFGLPLEQVSRFDIKKNRLVVFRGEETEPHGSAHLASLEEHTWPVCRSCLDFTAELADVSLGAVGSKPGETTLMVRTERGAELVQAAAGRGLLRLEAVRNLGLVERISENKRKRRAGLTPEETRLLLRRALRGNYKKARLKGQW